MRESLIKGGIPVVLSASLLVAVDVTTDAAIPARLLDILVANLWADFLIICVAFYSGIVDARSNLLFWYTKYGLSAVVMDTLIGVIYMAASYEIMRATSTTSLLVFGLTAIAAQWVGDLLFYVFFSLVPVGKNAVIDLFKEYAQEARLGALLGDTFLVIVAVLLSSLFHEIEDERHVAYILVAVSYLLPYVVHTQTFESAESRVQAPSQDRVGGRPPTALTWKHGMARSLGGV